jgi:peroxiredoxin
MKIFPNIKYRGTLILLSLTVAGYVAGVSAYGEPDHAHGAQAAKPGADSGTPPAPEFVLPDVMNGGQVRLSTLKGKWVFVNFWATWCSPCVYEMPMMNNFYHKMKKDGMAMLAISVDEGDAGPVKQFAAGAKLDFTILHDATNGVMRKYGVKSIPHTFVLDPAGNIQAAAEGMREWDDPEMMKFFRQLMVDFDKKNKTQAKNKLKACVNC